VKKEVSIIIVNYKTPHLLEACVSSIYKHTEGVDFEVIIVDNDSRDNSKELIISQFKNVLWIDSQQNVGFGRANNIGLKEAQGDYVVLINSDVELFENSILLTLDHLKSIPNPNKVGFVGCKIVHRDGAPQPSCNYWNPGIRELLEANALVIKFWQRILKRKILHDIDKYARLDENHEVTHLGVPFVICTREAIQENYFDENFFMYFEDCELNARMSIKGLKHYYFSGTSVYHHIGASNKDNEKRDRQIFASRLLYIKKRYSALYYRFFVLIFKFNLFLDGLADSSHLTTKKHKVWLKVYNKKVNEISGVPNESLNTYSDVLQEF
tara:strand:+ start:950 stop:1924 length:975 start_codon:yes stop_codon:yes gene_type:complete